MKKKTKSKFKYMGACFIFFVIVGFIFGPKYLNITPAVVVLLSIGGALLMGIREILEDFMDRILFGHRSEEKNQQVQDFLVKTTTVTDPVIVEGLIDKVIKAHLEISKMDMRKSETHNAIYWKILMEHKVMVGNPKLIKKTLKQKSKVQ